jgi:DNA-directed RNA polymerase specialized sigma subunit
VRRTRARGRQSSGRVRREIVVTVSQTSLTNQKIIDDLNITTAEEREMEVIISNDTKRQRSRERKQRERRSKGAIRRDEYLAKANKKRSLAYDLRHRQGKSYREIGEILGVSHTQVQRMIATIEAQLQ